MASTLEERVERLEQRLALGAIRARPLPLVFLLVASLLAAGLAFRGFGLPNHPYQWTLAILATALAYHRGWLLLSKHPVGKGLPLLNAFCLALIFKLFIGSGVQTPLSWLQYPEIANWSFSWHPSSFAQWSVDFTLLQTFFLLVTIVGALFQFQPFASLTALLLIFSSIPAFSQFQWNWVFPALLAAAVAFYLQSPKGQSSC